MAVAFCKSSPKPHAPIFNLYDAQSCRSYWLEVPRTELAGPDTPVTRGDLCTRILFYPKKCYFGHAFHFFLTHPFASPLPGC